MITLENASRYINFNVTYLNYTTYPKTFHRVQKVRLTIGLAFLKRAISKKIFRKWSLAVSNSWFLSGEPSF
jgi:hypothetical protein